MSKFKVNNIYAQSEITINDIISTFLLSFLDINCSNLENNDIIKTDTVLNN